MTRLGALVIGAGVRYSSQAAVPVGGRATGQAADMPDDRLRDGATVGSVPPGPDGRAGSVSPRGTSTAP
jgi:hypothetical protein